MSKGIELRTVVDQLREELAALTQTVKGEELQFSVESIELELKVGVTKGGEVGGKVGAKFWVFEVGEASTKGTYESEHTQTIKLTLKPKFRDAPEGSSQEVKVTDDTSSRKGTPTQD